MTRTRLSLALTTSFACTVGPRFVGETAESSSGAVASDDGGDVDASADDGMDATSADGSAGGDETSDCATSCEDEGTWPVLLDGPARRLTLDDDDSPRVIFSWPQLAAEMRTFTAAGEPGPYIPIGLSSAGQVRDFARDDDGAALLFHDFSGYALQGLAADLETVSWVSERVVDEGENLHVYAGDLGLAPGSGYVVAGVIGSDVEVAFVDAYDGAGGEMFSWSQEFPDYYPEAIAVLDDPEAITVWIRITALDGGSGDEHVVRFAADGTLLENDSFVSMANSLLPPLRSGDGWVSIGSPSENGGVRFDFMDAGFASTMIVDDPAIAPEDERFPILARPTPSGFVVVMYINDDSTSLDVRSYDHEGAPLHAETVSISSQVQSPEFIDVEAAADGTLYLVTDVPLMGGGHVHDTRLHRLAF